MKNKKSLIVISVIFVVIVIAVSVGAAIINRERNYRYTEVVSKQERMDKNSSNYTLYKNGMIRYGRDGITALDPSGELLFTGVYTMVSPMCTTAGDYVAVADIGNYDVVVFDEKGSAESFTMLTPVMEVSVSEQGELAVLMQGEENYEIQILDPYASTKDEVLKGVIYTYIKDDGYALDVAISKDGSKVVTSYVKVAGKGVSSTLTFYNFSGVGQGENADRIVGVYPYEDMIFTELEFLDNNTVLAVSDKTKELFSMRQKPELIWEEENANEILNISTGTDSFAMLVKDKEAESGIRLDAYSTSGKHIISKKLTFDTSSLGIGKNDIWAFTDTDMIIVSKTGKVKYSGTCNQNIQFMAEGKKNDLFLVVSSDYIEEIRLKEKTE